VSTVALSQNQPCRLNTGPVPVPQKYRQIGLLDECSGDAAKHKFAHRPVPKTPNHH